RVAVGSVPSTSSPSSARAMASRMAGVGKVTVSERKSEIACIQAPLALVWQESTFAQGMPKPKLQLIFTGGTISMRDDAGTGAVPVLRGEDLLREIPSLEDFCSVAIHDFGQLPGPHMTPARMLELSEFAQQCLARGADGVVITHGTDTLEESAYLLDLRHAGEQPIVFAGAMRTSSQLSWDGPVNLYEACRVAADPRS